MLNVAEFIAAEMRKKGDDRKAIIAALIKAADKDDELKKKMLELGADQMLRFQLAEGRRSFPSAESGLALPSEIRVAARLRFMDQYRLFGGDITLAKAKKDDLAKSARAHDAQANGHAEAAAFERTVGKRLPEGKRVEQVFEDEKLVELKKSSAEKKKVAA